MKGTLTLLLISMTMICFGQQFRHFPQNIKQQFQHSSYNRIQPLQISAPLPAQSKAVNQFTSKLKKYTLLSQSPDFINLKKSAALKTNIELTLPVADSSVLIHLVPNKIITDNFIITTAKGRKIKSPPSVNNHYYGIIQDVPSSLAAVSFTSNAIRGMISYQHNNLFLEPIHGTSSIALYDPRDLLTPPPDLNCATDDGRYEESFREFAPDSTNTPASCKTVRMYIECTYSLYTYFGSDVDATVDYVLELFNTTNTLFKREGVNLQISEIFIWDRQDIYADVPDIFSYLDRFRNRLRTDRRYGNRIQSDIAHALTYTSIGASAALGDIRGCKEVNVAVSTGLRVFGPFPTASYPVALFAHETGHQLGLPHTHSCSWPGGPIDNCAVIEDGLCQPGPTPVGGGSIMSYCSTIDFDKGFGPLPGALMRSIIDTSSCTQPCGSGACENLKVRGVTANLTDTTLLIRWNQESVKYRVGIKPNTTQKWSYYEVMADSFRILKTRCETAYDYSISPFCSEENKYALNNILMVGIPSPISLNIPFPLQDITVCAGNSGILRLKPDTLAMTYQWYINDVLDPGLTDGLIRVTRLGKYQAIGSMDGCSYTSDTILVSRRRLPPTFTCAIDKLTASFTGVTACGKRMLWEFGEGSTDTSRNPIHVYTGFGTYRVILKAWDAEEVMDSIAKDLILFESIIDDFNGASDYRQPLSVQFDKNFHCQQAGVFVKDSILHRGQAVVWYSDRDGTGSSKPISYPRTGTFEIKIFPDSATKKNTFGPLLEADTGLIMIARNTSRKFILEFSRWGGIQFSIDSFLIGNLQSGFVGPLRFHEWNTIGISYGNKGVEMFVNGSSVGKIDKPVEPLREKYVSYTIGYYPNIIRNDKYTFTGFAGGVDRIRFSNLEKDWTFSGLPAFQGTDTVFQKKSICFGESYQGDTKSGSYHRTDNTSQGCDSVTTTLLTVGTQLQLTDSIAHASTIDGSIKVMARGGFPPYSFSWSTGSTTPEIKNLRGGTYGVKVTDSLNCSISATYRIYAGTRLGEGFRVLPNPGHEQQPITLQIQSQQPGSYQLVITDVAGRILKTLNLIVAAGTNHIVADCELRKGLYLLRLGNAERQFPVMKLFIQ